MKRATIYLDDSLHKALKLKAFEANESISSLVNDAVRGALEEDLEDLTAIEFRKKEKPIGYASFLNELKSRGQI
ncbi:MAG TPA: CopG family transcriptional regulator [Spirochaetia bacterium]|nr:CopG family transcriptional regulator [Spirochaetia bacterium]